MGRWSRRVAREFLRWLAVEPGRQWLDVGCGTGALTETILALAQPAGVEAMDPSEGYLERAGRQIDDPRVTFGVGNAQAVPSPDRRFDAVVSGLVLNFVPDPPGAVEEMTRVAADGGVVAAYVWDYAEGMQLIRRFWDSAMALEPAAVSLDEGERFPLCRPEPLRSLFLGGGLTDVQVHAIEVSTPFRDFEDYWTPFLGGQGPAPSYVTSLSEEGRLALRDRLRSSLPIAENGTIVLTARAWAVRRYR
ncbi:MAG TPA: methyltransferase domain-containing protein [Acidimicrobiales bacterium]|nr:methyltransferase domain-containing protein [Acidimicrobiales bacterium]